MNAYEAYAISKKPFVLTAEQTDKLIEYVNKNILQQAMTGLVSMTLNFKAVISEMAVPYHKDLWDVVSKYTYEWLVHNHYDVVCKDGFCRISWDKIPPKGSLSLV